MDYAIIAAGERAFEPLPALGISTGKPLERLCHGQQ